MEICVWIFVKLSRFRHLAAHAIDLDQMKELVMSFRSSFPDARITIEDIVAEGDLVAARLMEQGTHGGEFKGIPPTGRQVTYGSMTFLRIVDGKIVDHWGLLDMPSLLQQLGLLAGLRSPPFDRSTRFMRLPTSTS